MYWKVSLSALFGSLLMASISAAIYSFNLESYLQGQANVVSKQIIAIREELTFTMRRLDQLKHSICTEDNLHDMRLEQFSANYIKDIGFYIDDYLVCTTGTGAIAKPLPPQIPDSVIAFPNSPDAFKVWWQVKLLLLDNKKFNATVIQFKRYNAVLNLASVFDGIDEDVEFTLVYNDRKRGEIFNIIGNGNKFKDVLSDNFDGLKKNLTPTQSTIKKSFSHHYYEKCLIEGYCFSFTKKNIPDYQITNLAIFLIVIMVMSGYAFAQLYLYFYSRRNQMASRLKKGIKEGSFYPTYQPIINLQTGELSAVEMLCRFRDGHGELYPDQFIPVIAKQNLSWELTRSLILRAMEDLKNLDTNGKFLMLTINVFPRDIINEKILGIKEITENKPSWLKLAIEFTEEEQIDYTAAAKTIEKLKGYGFRVAIDDFGTGYSNFNQVKRIDCDSLKIDRSFIAEMEEGSIKSSLIPHITAMANELNMYVVAEGIENQKQAQALRELNITYGQGWFFEKAMTIDKLQPFIESQGKFHF